MRFFTVVGALDTGSSFEGMGASREVFFSALAEPALFIALVTLARQTGELSLSMMFSPAPGAHLLDSAPVLALVVIVLMVVLLAENARIPMDDPNTHLELTMIHEVMVLDHGGPDLAFILYSSALKLWLFAALVVGIVLPVTNNAWLDLLLATGGMFVVAVIVGVIESTMARLRLVVVPQLLVGAGALAAMAFLLELTLKTNHALMTTNLILVLVALTNLKLLGSSRLGASIRVVALQGVVLGLLPILAHLQNLSSHFALLALGTITLKGVVFPWLLFRAVREAEVAREIEPYVGYVASLVAGVLALGVSFWMCTRLAMPENIASPWLAPVALFSIFAGLFLIVARKRALNQVLGFLVLENGIYTFGVGVVAETPFLVELGVLLDVFVAVLVMGIAVYHINREFDHIETDRLDRLKG